MIKGLTLSYFSLALFPAAGHASVLHGLTIIASPSQGFPSALGGIQAL